jgi:hypothetical protein
MDESKNREEQKRRLAQARRMAALPVDALIKERLERLARELEEQLRLSA